MRNAAVCSGPFLRTYTIVQGARFPWLVVRRITVIRQLNNSSCPSFPGQAQETTKPNRLRRGIRFFCGIAARVIAELGAARRENANFWIGSRGKKTVPQVAGIPFHLMRVRIIRRGKTEISASYGVPKQGPPSHRCYKNFILLSVQRLIKRRK